MKRFTLCALLLALLAGAASADPQAPAKKLIEYGWDVPTPAYVRAHVRRMEERPFDGLMMRLEQGGGQVFAGKRWDEAALQPDFQALRQIDWQKFTDNFLMMYSASAMDWFSDADWETIAANAALMARGARIGRCKGLVFDAEPYGENPWAYAKQARAKEKSFAEYQAMVRKRGAQFMQAMAREMPNLRLLTFFQLSLFRGLLNEPDPAKRESALAGEGYGLLPAFLNGMLDAAGPEVVITDGNESAYYYTSPLDFYQSYHAMRQRALALVAPENVRKYQQQMQASQALYVDYVFKYWDRKYIAEQLTPEERARWFEHNTYHALSTSDEYVWLYSEKMNWWKDEKVPPGIVEAITSARTKVAAGKPLGFELAEMMKTAQKRFQEAIKARLLTRTAQILRVKRGQWPTIDGNLADPVWQGATPLAAFVGYVTQEDAAAAKPAAETRAWATYDDAHLYLAFRCAEPDAGKMRAQGEKRDDPVWEGDSVDVFLSTGEMEQPYCHLILNPKNVRWDALCNQELTDTDFSPDWRSAVLVGKDEWTVEMAIPWAALRRMAPELGTKIRANLCRQRIPKGEQTSWSQCVGGFVEPDHFGTWVFR